jgi:hypothetical protein
MMSRTEIYKVKTNGDTTFYGEAPNSWGYGHWIENYKKIGVAHGYSAEQIEEYGEYIRMIQK